MKITQIPTVQLEVVIKLTEEEARALDALAGYDIEATLRTFYKFLGQAYLKPHEAGLRTLFDALRTKLPPILNRMDEARKVFLKPDALYPGDPPIRHAGGARVLLELDQVAAHLAQQQVAEQKAIKQQEAMDAADREARLDLDLPVKPLLGEPGTR